MGSSTLQAIRYIYWQEGANWLAYLEDYHDYWTQGESLDDLIDRLGDLYRDMTGGQVPGIRKVGELVIS